VLAFFLLGAQLQGLPGFDWPMGVTVFSLLFTAFAVAGAANAVNIIDGHNGLAAVVVVGIGGAPLSGSHVFATRPDFTSICRLSMFLKLRVFMA
jgi:UDP-N-acetylmuramyl pentapeptide phosphotransferase/UDP-N-acetylglucosamine-1-phosphate transferase